MFKLVAVLYVLTNGVPENSVGVRTYTTTTFPTVEACALFIRSEAFKDARKEIDAAVAAQGYAIVANFGCVKSVWEDRGHHHWSDIS